ncbi:hypothetical protein DD238_007976 [Peronospora effusa]|uniref:RNase H type-1 domain-containing protein n=1 Tax=Peronospora effusa TaxID=542832 RepID=A0A3M6V7X8_9STRA|nr:hypothetical protein DD238_007976 [Peronospora effusa]
MYLKQDIPITTHCLVSSLGEQFRGGALGVAYGPSDLEGVLSDDDDALDDPVDAASPSEVLAGVLPSPERAGGMLADQGALAFLLASSEACMHDGPATPPSTAVAMDVDEGALWTAPSQHPLSPPRELRVAGKRRCLNDVYDEDQRELAELSQLVDEDESGIPSPALRPSAASALPASVLSVFVHNVQHFQCTLCTYTAASFASLIRHRVSRHRRIAFMDRFSAGCACGTPFTSRLAAATHTQACTSLQTTSSAATAPAAGKLSPTAGAFNSPATVAFATPRLPRPDLTVLAVPTPPQSSTTGADMHTSSASRWDPQLPREMIAGRVAARLSETTAPCWGPPLPRSVVASRIADRLLPPELEEDDTKEGDDSDTLASIRVDAEDAEAQGDDEGEWLLRFDGACRANPGPGGAGAAPFKPSGPVVWTCSHYMSSSRETNTTAEYTALLLSDRAAADHGVKHLRVEGDSSLVIQQVRGIFATRSTRLRKFRTSVKTELARLARVTLHHIDRQANVHANRLANAALDRRASKTECGVHPVSSGALCTSLTTPDHAAVASPVRPATPAATAAASEVTDVEDDMGDIDDGEVCAAMSVGPDAVPQRRPRLRLRKLDDAELEAASDMVERLAATLAAKITDAGGWEAAEGYITALPHALYDRLQPYTQQQQQQHQACPSRTVQQAPRRQQQPTPEHRGGHSVCPAQATQVAQAGNGRSRRRRRSSGSANKRKQRTRPPRVTCHNREHRLDEALDDLREVGRNEPSNRKAVAKARRRVGRINSSIAQQSLRHQFETSEKACVDGILAAARSKRLSAEAPSSPKDALPPGSTDGEDTGFCPISGANLHTFFTAVNTPARAFDVMAPVGAPFCSALARLPAATSDMELLKDAPTTDDIEGQLQRARGISSPGLDGVGYDIYKMFSAQLLPALHAAFTCCWK